MPLQSENTLSISFYGISDIGLVRTENQDSFGKFPEDNSDLYKDKGLLFIIADGMGGHAGGKEASQSAIEFVSREYFSSNSGIITSALFSAFETANKKIYQSSIDVPQFQRKGTTCTALVLKNNLAHIAHVGDTRIYRIRDEKIEQLTNDHTQVEELLRKGIITDDEAKEHPSKSVLVRALGVEETVEIDIVKDIPINQGDNFVLCTDGLARVNKDEIKKIILNNSPEETCKKLIALANERGGTDNVTVQVISVNNSTVINQDGINKLKKSKYLLIFLLLLAIALIITAGIFYKDEILRVFSKSTTEVKNDPDRVNINSDVNYIDNILKNADTYLSLEQLDSALFLYDIILEKIPMHAGALAGKEAARKKLIDKGNKLLSNGDSNEALVYFKKGLAENPNDDKIVTKVQSLEKQLTNIRSPGNIDNKNQLEYRVENQPQIPEVKQAINKRIKFFNSLDWNFTGLNEKDYKINENGITFLSSNKIKKVISQKSMEDIEIEVDVKFESVSNNIAGIIIGYKTSDAPVNEMYFLFSVNNNGTFSLTKMINGRKEILKSVNHSSELFNYKKALKLKLKCLGPWIILYYNNKLLESWLGKDFIKGKVGLFSGANTSVNFTSVKISSAFENNR